MVIRRGRIPISRDLLLVVFASSVVVLLVRFTAAQVVDPFWRESGLHVPGEDTLISHQVAVDSMFYVRNADRGFLWSSDEPTSLWFHPLMTWLIRIAIWEPDSQARLWFLTQLSVFFGLLLTLYYARTIGSVDLPWYSVLLVPLLPGGLGMVAGNVEWLCLLLAALLLLSILRKWPYWLVILSAAAAILAKPNALYLVPALAVYALFGLKNHKPSLAVAALLGLGSLLITWLIWMVVVDLRAGEIGAYWGVRSIASVPRHHGPFSLIYRATWYFANTVDNGEKLRYFSALAIPLVQLAITIVAPIRNEAHRLSIVGSIFALLFITFFINNPNKIVVYCMTYPGHFASSLLFLHAAFGRGGQRDEKLNRVLVRWAAGASYLAFCVTMVVFYILGTPTEWYY